MEVALVGRTAARPELCAPSRDLRLLGPKSIGSRPRRVAFETATRFWKKSAAIRLAAVKGPRSSMAAEERESPPRRKSAGSSLFVGLPLDAVSECNAVNHAKAINAGLRALKLLGADGVELPVWWGIAQPHDDPLAAGDFSGYLAAAGMARDAGLHLRVALRLDAPSPAVPLPKWVSRIAEADPDVYFTDRAGRRRPECLSLAVDDLPVLDGRTPLQAYEDFFRSFRSAFSDLFGTTITDVSVGLGPNGELRYPSFPPSGSRNFTGTGEFQCYDKYMLANLKQLADASGNPLWGLSGPHDAPEYHQSPDTGFFKENGGSWETSYGDFFLSWYSGQLLAHGDRVLSIASRVFGDLPVTLSAKVPLSHWWHDTRSHASELTAGFYNTDGRDGYDAVAKMFAKNSCMMILPGMDLADRDQPQGLRSSPELLLSQIMRACEKHGVQVSGENSSLVGRGMGGFTKIKENLIAENPRVNSFTYQRMGAYFFSPEHWPLFTKFMRNTVQHEQDSDELRGNEERLPLSTESVLQDEREMQAA